jgi:hypothetical protein
MRTISLEQLIKYNHLAHSFLPHPFCIFFDVHNPCSLEHLHRTFRKHYPKTQAWPSHVLSSIVLPILSWVGSRGLPESECIGSAGVVIVFLWEIPTVNCGRDRYSSPSPSKTKQSLLKSARVFRYKSCDYEFKIYHSPLKTHSYLFVCHAVPLHQTHRYYYHTLFPHEVIHKTPYSSLLHSPTLNRTAFANDTNGNCKCQDATGQYNEVTCECCTTADTDSQGIKCPGKNHQVGPHHWGTLYAITVRLNQ